jgi:hypothetical protein
MPIPTPILTPTPSAAANAPSCNADTLTQEPFDELLDEEEKPVEWYYIDVLPLLSGTSYWKDLRAKNMMLWDIIRQAGNALEEGYAQMKLMDLENTWLKKQLLEKEKRKIQSKYIPG